MIHKALVHFLQKFGLQKHVGIRNENPFHQTLESAGHVFHKLKLLIYRRLQQCKYNPISICFSGLLIPSEISKPLTKKVSMMYLILKIKKTVGKTINISFPWLVWIARMKIWSCRFSPVYFFWNPFLLYTHYDYDDSVWKIKNLKTRTRLPRSFCSSAGIASKEHPLAAQATTENNYPTSRSWHTRVDTSQVQIRNLQLGQLVIYILPR